MRLGPSPVSDRSPTSRSNKTNKQSTKNGNGVSVCRAKENQSISMIKYMNCVCLFFGNFTVKLINKIEIGKFSISTAHQSSQPFGFVEGRHVAIYLKHQHNIHQTEWHHKTFIIHFEKIFDTCRVSMEAANGWVCLRVSVSVCLCGE